MKFSKRIFRPGAWLAVGLLAVGLVVPVLGDATTESQTRMLGDVKYLASDELEGRGVGTKGLDLAAEYIRDEFQEAGLDVTAVDGGAFQTFTMVTGTELGETNSLSLTGPDGKTIELTLGKDFQTCSFGGSGTIDADVVFCGYGIDAPDKHYSDFHGVDVKGKVALIMRRVPQQGNPQGPFAGPHGGLSPHSALNTKVSNAYSRGAAAVLFVNDPYTTRQNAKEAEQEVRKTAIRAADAAAEFAAVDPQNSGKLAKAREELDNAVARWKSVKAKTPLDKQGNVKAGAPQFDPLMEFGYNGNGKDKTVSIVHITIDACNRLLKPALNKTLAQLEAGTDAHLTSPSAVLKGWKAEGQTSVNRLRSEVKNVIGVLEGDGPLAGETVVIGAHYDHVGLGGEGSLAPGVKAVHNGADDNASGTAGLLELARRMASRPDKPARRVVFIAFTAEERGLIGSAHYVKKPVFPLDKTVAMLNMDMVGRLKDDKLTVFGTGTSPRWKKLLTDAAGQRELKVTMKDQGTGPSDHTSFYQKKIPVLHFFTGSHSDYHRPSDDWEKINVPGMQRVVDTIEQIARETIETPEPPEYVLVKSKSSGRRGGRRPYFGSIPDFGTEQEGYAITGAAPGSPAEKGGLKGGDVIVQLGQFKIGGLDDFDLALRKFKPGDEVAVTVLRDEKKVNLKVVLAKPR